MRCLRSICVCGLHGGNGVNEWMWQWGERSVEAKREWGGVCGVGKTSAIQHSPQPVNGNLMSSLASLLLSLPIIPLLFFLPPLLDLLLSFPPVHLFLEGTQPEKQHSAPSSLAADKLCSFQLDRQSSQLLSVGWNEWAKPLLFGLVAEGRMGRP